MRRAAAMRLTLLVALSGLLPIGIVGVVSLELLARRSERMSQEALRTVAQQAAARIGTYLAQERELLRALSAAPVSIFLPAFAIAPLLFVGGLTGLHSYLASTNQVRARAGCW